MYKIVLSRQAAKDKRNIKRAGLEGKARELLDIIAHNPYQIPPRYEKLVGDMQGLYSRRTNIQHRLVYDVDEDSKTIHVLAMWTHYGGN